MAHSISELFIYDEPSVPQIRTDELADFIEKLTGINVTIRDPFFKHHNVTRKNYQDLTTCRIFNPYLPFERTALTSDNFNTEEDRLDDDATLYDGFEIQNLFRDILPDTELVQDYFHLIFTTKIICTYDFGDLRYHGRAIICSNPSIISTTGMVEAPAKPREYYLRTYELARLGSDACSIRNEFKGRFLEINDERLRFVVRGYAVQSIFYYLTGDPFCESKDCILFNAHWQEDLLYSQVRCGKLCNHHQTVLDKM